MKKEFTVEIAKELLCNNLDKNIFFIPKGYTTISEDAFNIPEAASILELYVPEGIKSFYLCSFNGCKQIKDLYFPSTVKEFYASLTKPHFDINRTANIHFDNNNTFQFKDRCIVSNSNHLLAVLIDKDYFTIPNYISHLFYQSIPSYIKQLNINHYIEFPSAMAASTPSIRDYLHEYANSDFYQIEQAKNEKKKKLTRIVNCKLIETFIKEKQLKNVLFKRAGTHYGEEFSPLDFYYPPWVVRITINSEQQIITREELNNIYEITINSDNYKIVQNNLKKYLDDKNNYRVTTYWKNK